jgi:phosphatidylglycerol:prolipoprotein diacylglycerol transferase
MFEAFSFGPFLIWTRLVFLLLGIWLSVEFFLRLSTSAHMSLQHMRLRAIWYLGAFLAAGRIFAMIAEYRLYTRDLLRIFVVWDGGFSFLGGAIGVAAVLYWVTREQRATFLQWLDVLLPATTFGLFFDWMGRFASGVSYGQPTDLPWGVVYNTFGVRYTIPLHPVQLYYALFFLILTFVLLIVRKYSHRAGAETLIGILLASLATFLFEYMRGDTSIFVFATRMDFVVLVALFISLGVFAAVELSLSRKAMLLYEVVLLGLIGTYFLVRSNLGFESFDLRFSQFLSVLAVLGTFVYVLVHRKKYPNL